MGWGWGVDERRQRWPRSGNREEAPLSPTLAPNPRPKPAHQVLGRHHRRVEGVGLGVAGRLEGREAVGVVRRQVTAHHLSRAQGGGGRQDHARTHNRTAGAKYHTKTSWRAQGGERRMGRHQMGPGRGDQSKPARTSLPSLSQSQGQSQDQSQCQSQGRGLTLVTPAAGAHCTTCAAQGAQGVHRGEAAGWPRSCAPSTAKKAV